MTPYKAALLTAELLEAAWLHAGVTGRFIPGKTSNTQAVANTRRCPRGTSLNNETISFPNRCPSSARGESCMHHHGGDVNLAGWACGIHGHGPPHPPAPRRPPTHRLGPRIATDSPAKSTCILKQAPKRSVKLHDHCKTYEKKGRRLYLFFVCSPALCYMYMRYTKSRILHHGPFSSFPSRSHLPLF